MKILIIEDDKTIALGIQYALKDEEYEAQIAGNIKMTRDMFKNNEYDLLILDVMLPDGTGYDLCSEIRKASQVPIIFLTACDEEVNIIMGLDMGGDDYITKPFRVRELISRIKAVVRRRGNPKAHKKFMNFGELKIYHLEGKVLKGDRELILTSLEYRLLLTLCKNSGQIISRSRILDALWDFEGDFVNDNTLTVYIKRLREKLEDTTGEAKYIATVRGLGYKWICEEGEK